MSMPSMRTGCFQRPEEGAGVPEAGVIGSGEELSLGPLQEQPVAFLTGQSL